MKAISLIETLFKGWLDLEQGGVFTMHPETDELFVMRFFGARRIAFGKFEVGNYVYFYGEDGKELMKEYEPDIFIETKTGEGITIWKLEG